MTADADPRLIVALDLPDVDSARRAIDDLGRTVSFYKIGHQLCFAPGAENGLSLARELVAAGTDVFLDLKLLDIDNTVAHAVENVARMGVTMLTLHAYPKAMRAAVKAAEGSGLTLLGVTVLTSMDAADLAEAGYTGTPEALVLTRAKQARDAGMGGLVCSPLEAAVVREAVGPFDSGRGMAIVTPGIRPAGSAAGDQKRIMGPAEALAAGASHLVVGRPIMAASDRKAAAEEIVRQMGETA